MILKITLELCLISFSRTLKRSSEPVVCAGTAECSGSPAIATEAYNMDSAMVAANVELFSQTSGLSFELYMAFPYATVVVRSVGILIISLQLRERVEDIEEGKFAGDFWLSLLSLTSESPLLKIHDANSLESEDNDVGIAAFLPLCPICQSPFGNDNALWYYQFRAHQSRFFPSDLFPEKMSSSHLLAFVGFITPDAETPVVVQMVLVWSL